jgi:class 3 adenylate cyclase
LLRASRKNEAALGWLRAAVMLTVTWVGLSVMHVNPGWLVPAVSFSAAAITLFSAEIGVIFVVAALSIPILAVQPLLGIAALIGGIAFSRYAGAEDGRVFVVIACALLGALWGPAWGAAVIAGYLFGASEGALAAAVACALIEGIGVVTGVPTFGPTLAGGQASAVLTFANAPATLLSAEWLKASLFGIDMDLVNNTIAGIGSVERPVALLLQPALWACAAAVTGAVTTQSYKRERPDLGFAAVALGIAILTVGSALLRNWLQVPVDATGLLIAGGSSLVVSLLFVMAWVRLFPRVVIEMPPAPVVARQTVSAEDADVDELLRLIATAEEKLTTQHTTTRVVMLTDMKSFSRMTEEDGSVSTAKAIQRHRDLLLPIIAASGGRGKSTGGDGLVAAFEEPARALTAAIRMQQALTEHNASHPGEREIYVRIGIASGEVVLDNGGRPFIGAALNLAARIMNLADGGQILASGEVARAARTAGARVHYFGEFELKNIGKPAEIAEVMWSPEQTPKDPRIALEPAIEPAVLAQ